MPDWEAFVRTRLASADLKPQREQRIVRELAHHLEEFYQEALSRGLPEAQAEEYASTQVPDWDRLVAEIQRADPSAARPPGDRLSDAALRLGLKRRGFWPVLSDLLDDLLYGVRVLAKRPGFALIAVLTLALGIGASTAIFSVINGTLLRPLPYPQPDRLAMLWETNLKRGWTRQLISLANVPAYRASASIEEIAAIWIRTSLLAGDGEDAETVTNARVEYRFFSTLGVQPALGRAFLEQEDRRGKNAFVILSNGLWMRRLAGSPDILGQSLQLDGQPYEIVGVMPEGFRLITFLAVPALLMAVALLACYLPARRATRIDPIQALRCE